MLGMNSIFERKRLKIAKFFTLKRSKILGGSAITALGDTNPSDATGLFYVVPIINFIGLAV